MHKTILKLFAAIVLGSAIFACKKSFLERLPQASLSEAALANEKGVNASLIAAYAALDGWTENGWGNAAGNPWPAAGSNWIFGSVASDDAYPGSQPIDQQGVERVNRYEWNTDDPYFRAKWQTVYMGVGRANTTLRLLAKATDMSATAKDALAGEARFLRAHYHFEAYKMWKNVPFIDETVTDFRLSNDADPFPKIEADLKFAIDKLPLKASDASGRTNKGAAQSYLARAYMFVGKYAEAKPLLQAVIASARYRLVDNFHDNFDAAKQNNPEMVFVYKASVNDGAGESANGNWGDRLNAPHGGPVTSCCGFHQPSFNLVNAFKTDAVTGLPLFGTFNNSNLNPATDFVDPRLDWTVGRDNTPYLDWGRHSPTWIRDAGYGGPFSPKKNLFHKAQNGTLSTASGWQNVPNAIDIPLMRYSDVLLMAAECEIETNGDLGLARTYVNQVRERAGKFVQGPGTTEATISVPFGTGIFDWARYKVGTYPAGMSQAQLREAVRFERRLELAMEGHRLFDLRRWGVDVQVLNEYLTTEKQRMPTLFAAAQTVTAKHRLYPIPSVEIELSRKDGAAQLKQNPGY